MLCFQGSEQQIPVSKWTTLSFDGLESFTCQETGDYFLHAGVAWEGEPLGYRALAFYINGIRIALDLRQPYLPDGFCDQIASTFYPLRIGDMVEVKVLQNSGRALSILIEEKNSPVFRIFRGGDIVNPST